MNKNKAIYWLSTGLVSMMNLGAAVTYFVKYSMVSETVANLGFPVYIVYPLGAAKFLGSIAILTDKVPILRELAYAGFFYTYILACSAHINVGDGDFIPPIVAMALLVTSYKFHRYRS